MAVVAVVVASAGMGGPLGACPLGSWVESVVTSVTGGFGLLATGVVGGGGGGVKAATVVLGGLTGTAAFAFLMRRRRSATSCEAAAPCTETVTGCEIEWATTGSGATATLATEETVAA